MAVLPREIMLDILSRLPVKTLGKLRCVSKSWGNLISDPYFLELHRDQSMRNLRFLFISNHDDDFRPTCNFTSTDKENNVLNAFTAKVRDRGFWVLHTRCDLVCFSTQACRFICLCNPSTQRVLALPSEGSFSQLCIAFGFGYLPSTKEYKVVRLYCKRVETDWDYSTIYCEVFTLSGGRGGGFHTCSWRSVKERCPYFVETFHSQASIDGTIYWMISYSFGAPTARKAREEEFVVSFNTESEKFKTISYPAECSDTCVHNKYAISITELWGMLCMVNAESTRINSTLVVWTLQEDYDDCIWVKGYSINMAAMDQRNWGVTPKYLIDGEIILGSAYMNICFYYNIESKSFRRAPLEKVVGEVVIYWESFVSLGSRG